ncbi:MAG: transglycosylase SLT domain-containing protein [Candidatus Melainabacteria bacterium]|nr:transglycosylase SLT domain-containing protein [Candidatus Melainabacteria bacterium]
MPPRSASLDAPVSTALDTSHPANLSAYVHTSLMPDVRPAAASSKELPSHVTFTNDIYPSQSTKSDLLKTDPSKISFTTPAEDAKSGKQPDYYLNTQGQLVKNPKATPSADGSVKIEVEGNNTAKQAKQYADQLQKQAIGELISQFKAANPGAKVPEMWQSIVDAQPDASYPNGGDNMNNNTVTPQQEQAYDSGSSQPAPPSDNTPAPQPQPSDSSSGGGGGGSSSGGGSDSGSGGGGGSSGGGGGGDSGGGGGGSSGGGGGGSSGGGGGGDSGGGGGGSSDATPAGGGTSYDGASTNVDQKTLLENVKIVAEVAKQLGVDPTTAVADMLVESGGNNKAAGDGGHSIGLFQLNDAGGEGTGMSVAEREDPRHNAEIALSHFAKASSGEDPGVVAYNAERPADRSAYVAKVDATIPKAQELLKQAGVA